MLVFVLKQKQLEIEEAKHKRAEEDLKETEISKILIFLYFFLFGLRDSSKDLVFMIVT